MDRMCNIIKTAYKIRHFQNGVKVNHRFPDVILTELVDSAALLRATRSLGS